MVKSSEVTAVIVTRGNVCLDQILESLEGFGEILVCNNGLGINMGPLGQFITAAQAKYNHLYFQDDDCVTNPSEIVSYMRPTRLVCNLGTAGHAANYVNFLDKLMGFGSCFEKSLIKPTFEKYLSSFEFDKVLWREPGRIFTGINSLKTRTINVPFKNLPWAEGEDRLYKDPRHMDFRDEARKRIWSFHEANYDRK